MEPLTQSLKEGNWYFRSTIAEILGKIGDERAVEPLIEALKNENRYVRSGAVMALGKIGDLRAIEPLIRVTSGDKDSHIREEAAEALVRIGKPAVEPLIQALKAEKTDARLSAAVALAKIGDARAEEHLIRALKDEYGGEREANALHELGDHLAAKAAFSSGTDALQLLIKTPEELDPRTKVMKKLWRARALIKVLKKFCEWQAESEYPVDVTEGRQDKVEQALIKIGETAVEPLTQSLKEGNWYFRSTIAEILGKIGDERAVEPLINELNELKVSRYLFDKTLVRKKVAWALGEIGDERAVEPLIKALKDEDGDVMEAAKKALEKIKAKKS